MLRGWKTSEFWITVGVFVGHIAGVVQLPHWATAFAAGAYALSRGIAKSFGRPS